MKFELETTFVFKPNGKPGPTIKMLMNYQKAPAIEKGQPSAEDTKKELAFFIERFRDMLKLTGTPKSMPSTITGNVIIYEDYKAKLSSTKQNNSAETFMVQGKPYQWQSISYFEDNMVFALPHEVVGHGCFYALLGSKYKSTWQNVFFEEGIAELFNYHGDGIDYDIEHHTDGIHKSLEEICNLKFNYDKNIASYSWAFLALYYMQQYATDQFIASIQAFFDFDLREIEKIFSSFSKEHEENFQKWRNDQEYTAGFCIDWNDLQYLSCPSYFSNSGSFKIKSIIETDCITPSKNLEKSVRNLIVNAKDSASIQSHPDSIQKLKDTSHQENQLLPMQKQFKVFRKDFKSLLKKNNLYHWKNFYESVCVEQKTCSEQSTALTNALDNLQSKLLCQLVEKSLLSLHEILSVTRENRLAFEKSCRNLSSPIAQLARQHKDENFTDIIVLIDEINQLKRKQDSKAPKHPILSHFFGLPSNSNVSYKKSPCIPTT